jgi:hypothetical protein
VALILLSLTRVEEQMNRLIAEGVASIHRPGDIVWAHGYELIVLSKEVRALTTNPRVVRARDRHSRLHFFKLRC